jgi:hypothetical protein
MTPAIEKRLLQAAIVLALPLSVFVSIQSIATGPAFLGRATDVPTDLDSHFRYLSGIFLALLVAFMSCIPDVERKGARLRLLGVMVMTGGAARAISLVAIGPPSRGHLVGLCLELGVTPLLLLWQARVARRFA